MLDDYFASGYTDAEPPEVRLPADKAYSHPSTRRELRRRRIKHTVPERAFNRLKQWRGIATRYDKYALTFLGGVLLAATIMTTRTASRN